MKYIKYFICWLLLTVVLLCTGELFQLHITQMDTGDYVTVKFDNIPEKTDLFTDFDKLLDDFSLSAYYYIIESDDASIKTNLSVYFSDDMAKEYFVSTQRFYQGSYNSVFMSTSDVVFLSLSECESVEPEMYFYLLGEDENKEDFIKSLSEKYPVDNYSLNAETKSFYKQEAFQLKAILWVLACAVIIGLTLYETAINMKEIAVRCSLGETASIIYIKKVLIDSFIISALFIVSLLFTLKFTNVLFDFKSTVIFFVILLVVNAISLFPILFVNLRKAFAFAGNDSLLSASYALKIVTCVLTVFAVAITMSLLSETLEIKKEQEFFEQYKDYSYINMRPANGNPNICDESAVLLYRLQKECFAKGGVLIQSEFGDLTDLNDGKSRTALVFNKFAEEYLLRVIPELKEYNFNKEQMYVIVPEYDGYENDTDTIKEWAEPSLNGGKGFFFAHDYDIEFLTYSSNAKVLAISDKYSGKGQYYNNPIIFFSNLDESKLSVQNENGTLSVDGDSYSWEGGLHNIIYSNNMIFCVTDEEMEDFAKRYNFSLTSDYYSKSNVYDNIQNKYEKTKSLLNLLLTLTLILFIMEIIQISIVIRLEYIVNAKELAVKKVLGYSIASRNKKILSITIIVMILCLIGALVINIFIELSSSIYIVLGCVLLTVCEIAVILRNIIKTEKLQVVKILKGGAL